jgi:hypothetical protein
MRVVLILYLLMVMLFASAAVSGYSDKVALWPFSASFDFSTTEKMVVDVHQPVKQNDFIKHEFQLLTGDHDRELVNVTIYDYGNGTDVSENKLMDLITNSLASQTYKATWDRATVGNMSAIRAKIRSSGKSSYFTAYSPDKKNNTGNVIVLVQSFAPSDVTDSFLRSLQIVRVY